MRLTYYRFPDEMPIRACYDAWMKDSEDYAPLPPDMTDEEVERDFPRTQLCNVTTAKKYIRKYGGSGFTEHIDRDGGCFEVTPIEVNKRNKGTSYDVKYNRHL